MLKKTIFIFIIFIIGGLGGILIPYLLSSLLKLDKGGPVIINKTEQVVISHQTAVDKAYQKNIASLVSVVSLSGNPRTQRAEQSSYDGKSATIRGFGFIVSSDGLILTRREWVPVGNNNISIIRDNDALSAEVVKRSDDEGLVLLKVEASNLPTVSFSALEDNQLGSDLFLIGLKQGSLEPVRFIDMGILKSKDGSILETNIIEDSRLVTGTPLLNLNGDVVGISAVNSANYVFAISANAIKKFTQ